MKKMREKNRLKKTTNNLPLWSRPSPDMTLTQQQASSSPLIEWTLQPSEKDEMTTIYPMWVYVANNHIANHQTQGSIGENSNRRQPLPPVSPHPGIGRSDPFPQRQTSKPRSLQQLYSKYTYGQITGRKVPLYPSK